MSTEGTEIALVGIIGGVWLLVLGLFALPSVMAFRRGDPNRWLILALNASVAGWVLALILALRPLIHWDQSDGRDVGATNRAMIGGTGSLPVGQRGTAGAGGAVERPAAGAVTEIERLGRLRASGHLTDAEFAAAKSRVIEHL